MAGRAGEGGERLDPRFICGAKATGSLRGLGAVVPITDLGSTSRWLQAAKGCAAVARGSIGIHAPYSRVSVYALGRSNPVYA